MRITHYGHACVLVETAAGKRVLIDPGTDSIGFEGLRDLDLVLITHGHPDHLDPDRLPLLLELNPDATVVHSPGAGPVLAGVSTTIARPGDKLAIGGVEIVVTGGEHACLHPDLPESDNNGYLLDGAVFHPGDALEVPDAPVDVLLAPAGGPWMSIREGIDYVRAVSARIAVPIHQAGLVPAHQAFHHQLLTALAPAETEVVVLDPATPREF